LLLQLSIILCTPTFCQLLLQRQVLHSPICSQFSYCCGSALSLYSYILLVAPTVQILCSVPIYPACIHSVSCSGNTELYTSMQSGELSTQLHAVSCSTPTLCPLLLQHRNIHYIYYVSAYMLPAASCAKQLHIISLQHSILLDVNITQQPAHIPPRPTIFIFWRPIYQVMQMPTIQPP